ncbi:UPF0280 family protein [Candidatus Puniceispirillum sp.]|nr:UPF0280 family protein [Candidatus Puniceispirillum sp.]
MLQVKTQTDILFLNRPNLPMVVGVPLQMPSGAVANWLDQRLHLQHGPIDLIIRADGAKDVVIDAFARAADAFDGLLATLVEELPILRAPANASPPPHLEGLVAKRMGEAIRPHLHRYDSGDFITPMLAVAGSVADYILYAMGGGLDRAIVNNGGDIALHLSKGTFFDIGIADDRDVYFSNFTRKASGKLAGNMPLKGQIRLSHEDKIGGVATSGWRGRSHSLGIADSVTVLAKTAADADVAATLIANAISVSSPVILRQPANELAPDSDLQDRLVTVAVGFLTDDEIYRALAAGSSLATAMHQDGQIAAVYARLQGRSFMIGR